MTPETALQLRLDALEVANSVRAKRAELHAKLLDGSMTLEEVLADPPPCLKNLPMFELLQWVPGIKHARAKKVIGQLVSETLPVPKVGPSTRAKLLARLEEVSGGQRCARP